MQPRPVLQNEIVWAKLSLTGWHRNLSDGIYIVSKDQGHLTTPQNKIYLTWQLRIKLSVIRLPWQWSQFITTSADRGDIFFSWYGICTETEFRVATIYGVQFFCIELAEGLEILATDQQYSYFKPNLTPIFPGVLMLFDNPAWWYLLLNFIILLNSPDRLLFH